MAKFWLLNLVLYQTAKEHFKSLTHWDWETLICVSKLSIIGSDNGFSPGRRHAIIWTNAGILLIGPLGMNFSEILIEIYIFSFKNMPFKCRQEIGGHFVSASMLTHWGLVTPYGLTAPSHYLNQCWLIISKVKWHSSKGKFTRDNSAINHWNYLEN